MKKDRSNSYYTINSYCKSEGLDTDYFIYSRDHGNINKKRITQSGRRSLPNLSPFNDMSR